MDLAHVNTINSESVNNETSFSIQQLQEKDRDLNIVKKWLEKNKRPSFCEIGKYGFVVKCLWSQWNDLRFKLVYFIENRRKTGLYVWLYHFVKDDGYFNRVMMKRLPLI